MKTFLSYEGLPIKSGGAHSLKNKDFKENYIEIRQFLENYASKIYNEEIELSLYESAENKYSILKNIFNLILTFGIPKYRNDGLNKSWNWTLTKKQIEKGFHILKLNKKLTENSTGAISLNFKWNFYFKDAKTKIELPNQKLIPKIDFRLKPSQIYLRLSEKSTVSVWFAFPFDEINNYEKEYIENMKTFLPFKISDKQWKIWKYSKNGNWTARKIEI
ncbi:hypothetical protein [Faecalibacter macacae]|uniref:Uncharacterized protein n=1 Tax=Faecalibacter macacae TaxID=1859289 RepID=A0A3L9LZQ4_9FLAO|nr:hypothetical protein [Faecalibacter macacae]RLZ06387.1 hypothetical protein EAH69_13730 [Faecalibacter macacae]